MSDYKLLLNLRQKGQNELTEKEKEAITNNKEAPNEIIVTTTEENENYYSTAPTLPPPQVKSTSCVILNKKPDVVVSEPPCTEKLNLDYMKEEVKEKDDYFMMGVSSLNDSQIEEEKESTHRRREKEKERKEFTSFNTNITRNKLDINDTTNKKILKRVKILMKPDVVKVESYKAYNHMVMKENFSYNSFFDLGGKGFQGNNLIKCCCVIF